jgi:hypothetical protein
LLFGPLRRLLPARLAGANQGSDLPLIALLSNDLLLALRAVLQCLPL